MDPTLCYVKNWMSSKFAFTLLGDTPSASIKGF